MKLWQKTSLIVTIVLIIAGLLIPSVGIASTSNAVNTNEAKQAALHQIEKSSQEIAEWNNATVSEPVLYYAPEETISAYEFTVINDDKNVGFIIVSARKDWMPILEYADGSAPSSYLPYAKQLAIDKNYISENDNSKPCIFYWGACTYSVQFGEKMESERAVIQLDNGIDRTLPKESPVLQMDSQEAREAWSRILGVANENHIVKTIRSWFSPSRALAATDNRRFGEQTQTTAISKNLTGVPAFYQGNFWFQHGDDHDSDADNYPGCVGNPDDLWNDWDGCSPISGAMVIGYWYSKGYTSLPNPAYQETEEILIDHCHYWMGTAIDGSTQFQYIDYGMWRVTNYIYGYNFATVETDISWEWVTYEIDNGRPFVLSMWDNPTYGNHSVCAYGYKTDGGNQIRIFNTRDTSANRYIAYGAWSSAKISDVHP
ncbi:MAG TPA: C39 family peptidase [Dehalococcoidales bacterium]